MHVLEHLYLLAYSHSHAYQCILHIQLTAKIQQALNVYAYSKSPLILHWSWRKLLCTSGLYAALAAVAVVHESFVLGSQASALLIRLSKAPVSSSSASQLNINS